MFFWNCLLTWLKGLFISSKKLHCFGSEVLVFYQRATSKKFILGNKNTLFLWWFHFFRYRSSPTCRKPSVFTAHQAWIAFMFLECLDASDVLILEPTVIKKKKKHRVNVCLLGGMGYMDLRVPELLGSKTLNSLQLSKEYWFCLVLFCSYISRM